MKDKQIMISEQLFRDIYGYFEFEQYDKAPRIREELNKKLESLAMHEIYTKSKTADSEEEREEARQQYLDARGIRRSFRW